MGALYILRAVDTVVDAKTRPVWNRWLAAQLSRIVELASGGGRVRRPATVTASASTRMVGEAATELVFRRVDKKRFAALIAKARKAGDRDQAQLLEELGAVEAALVPDVVMLMIDGTFPASRVTPAVLRLLARSDTRDAVWAVLQPRLRTVFPALPITEKRELVIALGGLCSAQDAMDVEELLESIVRRDALPLVSAASTNIDRCARAKAAAGDIRAALRR